MSFVFRRCGLQRCYSTARAYVPPSQPRSSPRSQPSLPAPESPSFYTARAGYYDQLVLLENIVGRVQFALKKNYLLPLPAFARASLPPLQSVWKTQSEMATDFGTPMSTSRHRKVVALLAQLNDFLRISDTAGCTELARSIDSIVSMFERGNKADLLTRGKRKKVTLDEYGRSYTVGKRKTGSARVWMIPVKTAHPEEPSLAESVEDLLGLDIDSVEKAPKISPLKLEVTTSTIIVNNLPLHEYFPLPADREAITRPLKVAGVLGAYNVFAIVRGGGTTGQSGALAQGIAKGIVAHEPKLEVMLRRSKLTRRDPRMVERKKTGLAKARKAYTWVKR